MSYSDLILTRELKTAAPAPEWPPGFQCQTLRSPEEPSFALLDAFCTANGFPPNWVAEMLHAGRSAWVVVAQDNAKHQDVVAAGGWIVRDPFYIEEIGRTFHPGSDGVYLFGDFVGETWRGKGLQRQLVRERLRHCMADGVTWAYAMARDNNPASMKSYSREGFITVASIHVRFKGPLRLDHFRRVDGALPYGRLTSVGLWLPLGYRLRRRGRQ